jgi:hypothetical protein
MNQQPTDKAVVLQEERAANPVVFQNDFLKGFTGTDFSVGKVENLIRSTPAPQPPAKPAQVDFGGVKAIQNAPKVINYRAPNVMEKLSPPPMPPRVPLSELVVPPAVPAQTPPPQPVQPAPHDPAEPVRL